MGLWIRCDVIKQIHECLKNPYDKVLVYEQKVKEYKQAKIKGANVGHTSQAAETARADAHRFEITLRMLLTKSRRPFIAATNDDAGATLNKQRPLLNDVANAYTDR